MRVMQTFRLWLFLNIALALVACGGSQATTPTPASTSVPGATLDATAPATATTAPVASINRGKGDPDAPVTVIEYSDFQ